MSLAEEDEWELINDDGFVYKRKKRPRLDITAATSAPPPPDPAAEAKNRRIRKKKALLKLKEKYEAEILRWDILSNTLREFNLKIQDVEKGVVEVDGGGKEGDLGAELLGFSRCGLVDEILGQVEEQETIINNVSNLCDVAEALCNVHEEHSKQLILDLPVWDSSPRQLMNSLCDE